METIATIRFTDAETDEDTVAVVRANRDVVAVALSARNDGDLEIFIPASDCANLLRALQRAVEVAHGAA